MAESPRPTASADAAALAFSLCHEIANLVGAVRMHSHLLDTRMTPRELAGVSVQIDDLCARSAALIAHLRPLLDVPSAIVSPADPADVVAGLCDVMTHHGGRGTRLRFDRPTGLSPIEIEHEVLHHLLQSLLFVGLEAAEGRGTVGLSALRGDRDVVFSVDDDGPDDEDALDWRSRTPRGRPLVCAVADAIVGKRGGSLEVTREAGRTRVSLRIPTREERG